MSRVGYLAETVNIEQIQCSISDTEVIPNSMYFVHVKSVYWDTMSVNYSVSCETSTNYLGHQDEFWITRTGDVVRRYFSFCQEIKMDIVPSYKYC